MGNSQSDSNDSLANQGQNLNFSTKSDAVGELFPSQKTGATTIFDFDEIWKPDSIVPDAVPRPGGASLIEGQKYNSKALRVIHGGDIFNIAEIGNGMFGKAFKGTIERKQDNKPFTVAIKVFRTSLSTEEGSVDLPKLMGLRHRNITPILGVIVDNSNAILASPQVGPRIVLQHFAEGNVLNYLSKKENPQDYAMLGKLALDVINGIQYLHSLDIIHGNLAARNILIQKCVSPHKTHYNALVSDYGISQLALSTSCADQSEGEGNDCYLECIRWMPPELAVQIKAKDKPMFTKKTDVWSFGVVLWEMWMKGAVPFGSSKVDRVHKFLVNEGRSPISLQRPKGLPEHILFVMESTFKVDPGQRPSFDTLSQTFTSFKVHYLEKKGKESGGKKSDATPKKSAENSSNKVNESRNTNEASSKPKKVASAPQATPQPETQRKKKNTPPPPPPKQPKKAGGAPPTYPGVPLFVPVSHVPPPPFGPVGMSPGPTHIAPPPYTPSPLPGYFHGSPGPHQGAPPVYGAGNLETEIQKRERELEALRTQQLQAQFLQKQAEMDAIVRQLAQQNLSTVSGVAPPVGMHLGAGGAPPVYRKGANSQKEQSRKPRSGTSKNHNHRGRSKSRNRRNSDDDANAGGGGTRV